MSRARALLLLSLLYTVQGLPFGFQATALPVYLRAQGVSLTGVALAGALSLPWAFKILWGPAVDRYGSRWHWILPLQLALALATGVAASLDVDQLVPLLGAVLAMNLFASTMDVAVDGLAVDVLRERDLGLGNAAQVVGFKVGMLIGGGLLVWASGRIGWDGLFAAMTGIILAVWLAVTLLRRSVPRARGEATTFREVWAALRTWMASPGSGWALAFLATYKLGESMADTMWKPFLVDTGMPEADIGLIVGTWGMGFSMVGSLAGGVLASRLNPWRALAIAAVLRVGPVAAEWLAVSVDPSRELIIAVTCAEHFFGGALTTTVFAWMMWRVDPRIGATHFTALATVEVLGKAPGGFASGPMAQALGYGPVFATATVLSAAFLLLLVPLRGTGQADAR